MIAPLRRLHLQSLAVIAPALVISITGLLTVYATESKGDIAHTDRQLIFIALSLAAVVAMNLVSYQRIGRWAFLLFVAGMILLIPMILAKFLPLDSFIPRRGGARRWIQFPGFQLQPSELMKIAYILALAWYLRFRRNYRTLRGLVGPFTLTLLPMALILLQPDLGTVLLFMPMLFFMLFAAGARMKHFFILMVLAALSVPGFWTIMPDYQKRRVVAVLLQNDDIRNAIVESQNPNRWAWLCSRQDAARWKIRDGYQLICSKAALGSGGLAGQPWRQGTYVKYDILPDKHNDFIFAVIGHQFGFIGCVVVLACFGIIVLIAFDIAATTNDPFGRLVAVGAATLLATQVLINVSVTVGLMPITGMTLPFASCGGSSLLTSYLLIGLLINVAQRKPILLAKKPFTFDKDAPNADPRATGLAGVG